MKRIVLVALSIALAAISPAAAEQKRDLRGARPGMTVKDAIKAVESNGGVCGNALKADMPFIRNQAKDGDQVNYSGGIYALFAETGNLICSFKGGDPNLINTVGRDTIIMNTTVSASNAGPRSAVTRDPVSGLPAEPPSWDQILNARVLTTSFTFSSALNEADVFDAVLEQFDKKLDDVRGLRGPNGVARDATSMLMLGGAMQNFVPQIDLGDGLKLIFGSSFFDKLNQPKQYTLVLANDSLMRAYFQEQDKKMNADKQAIQKPHL